MSENKPQNVSNQTLVITNGGNFAKPI